MNTPGPKLPRSRLLLPLALALAGAASHASAQTSATVTVNANSVVREVPGGLMGSNTGTGKSAKFWQNLAPNYRVDAMNARMGLIRITAYPEDVSGTGGIDLADLDYRVAQVVNAGAQPLLIQAINDIGKTYSDSRDAAVHAKYMDLNGDPYPAGSTVPTAQRIATNMAYLVNRYKNPPFNLAKQIWEVGNEPDLASVNYRVVDPAEYIATFKAVHNQLVASGLRDNVTLCGPVTSFDYASGYHRTIMDAFLDQCAAEVDIVTRHIYGAIYSWENIAYSPYSLLNSSKKTAQFNSSQSGATIGETGLLAKMNAEGLPSTVGTGITEMNVGSSNEDGSYYRHTITQGLWFLVSDHYSLYNPRSLVTAGFKFDTTSGNFAYYRSVTVNGVTTRIPSYSYWATYMHGRFVGDELVSQSSSNSHLVVTASKDADYVYVQVINRHNTVSYSTTVTINNAPPVSAPTRFRLSATETPDVGVATTHGTSFTETFAPMTATVFRYPRTDAPVPPTPPAPPSTVLIDTEFDSAPAGVDLDYVGFVPAFGSGRLHLTHTSPAYSHASVVFAGQSLPSAASRVQARFRFKVLHKNAEGFVFGAYSAAPNAVGGSGQGLGYAGQPNRIWGVKVDNNPDQLAVVAGLTNEVVEGFATLAIEPYENVDLYAVIDYDGAAGTVRARIYNGVDDTGALRAEVTNHVGNPATLPAGTVFGFTGATGQYTQTTYIENLRITTESAATPGTPFTLQSFTSSPWNATSGVTSFSGGFSPDGTAVTMTFANPKTGSDVTNPASPDHAGAVASFFGFEGTGFGVGNSGLGRFERGESFTLQANKKFTVQEIRWYECNGDEQVHLRWTENGSPKQQVVSVPTGSTIRVTPVAGVYADANTPVTITNVSPNTNLSGRLRLNHVVTALIP